MPKMWGRAALHSQVALEYTYPGERGFVHLRQQCSFPWKLILGYVYIVLGLSITGQQVAQSDEVKA